MGTSEFSIDLHDELSLALEFLHIKKLLLFKLAAGGVGLLRLLYLIQARLDDLVLYKNALLQLFCRLGHPLVCRPVVPLVVSALLVKLKLQGAGNISFEREHIKVRITLHKICEAEQALLHVLINAQVLWHVSGH